MHGLLCCCLLLTGCVSSYQVRGDDLADGQRRALAGERDVVVPAERRDGTPVYLEVDEILEESPDYGSSVAVTAYDPRPGLLWSGGYLFAGGVAFGAVGLATLVNPNIDGWDRIGGPLFLIGSIPLLTIGGGLLLGGLLTDGPEEDALP